MKGGEDVPYIETLDDDMLHLIFKNLSICTLRGTAQLVCQKWRRAVQSCPVKELRPFPLAPEQRPWGKLEDELVNLAGLHATSLEVLYLIGLQELQGEGLAKLLENLRQLRVLHISSCPRLDEGGLKDVARFLPPSLEHLELRANHSRGCPHTVVDAVMNALAKQCTRLRHLDVDVCTFLQSETLLQVAGACRNLTHVSLHSNSLEWGHLAALLQQCSSLQHLAVTSSAFRTMHSSGSLVFTNDSGDMKLLRVDWRQDPAAKGPAQVAASMPPSLVSLQLYERPHASVLWHSPSMQPLLEGGMSQIRHLSAQGTYNAAWQSLGPQIHNLVSLDISNAFCENLTMLESKVLGDALQGLSALRHLALPGASDHVLRQLAKYSTGLVELRCQGYLSILNTDDCGATSKGIILLAEGCTALRVLSMPSCQGFNPASLRALAFLCRDLRALHLCGSLGVNDESIEVILRLSHLSLRILDAHSCKKVSGNILDSVLRHSQEGRFTLRLLVVSPRVTKNKMHLVRQLTKPGSTLRISTELFGGMNWRGLCPSPASAVLSQDPVLDI